MERLSQLRPVAAPRGRFSTDGTATMTTGTVLLVVVVVEDAFGWTAGAGAKPVCG